MSFEPTALARADFQALFEASPHPCLILLPDSSFTIIAVNERYLSATGTKRAEITGRGLFDVFPDNPDDSGSGVSDLRISLERVINERAQDVMGVQKYDIPRPDGSFEVKYWSPVNTPVFEKAGLANPVVRCTNGDQALDYLFQRGEFSAPGDAPRPSVVLLDLNLPGTDGREVLRLVKSDPVLKMIPVIVLTTSNDNQDIERCYRDGANTYVQKPVDLQGFIQAIARLRDFWFEVAILPRNDA